MAKRLALAGVVDVAGFMALQPKHARALWRNVTGERLWYALHGYAIEAPGTERNMFGHGRVLPPDRRGLVDAREMARLLLTKAARRMRRANFYASALYLWLRGYERSWGDVEALGEVSEAVIRGLVQTGALEAVSVSADQPYPEPNPGFAPPDLSDEQAAAAGQLRDAVAARGFETLLLDGVTGSGKTEVYMEAIAAAIDAGRQALVLLPEIALTEPMLTRFAARFGCEPVAWHSGLRSVERRRAWHAIASGEAKIVVGARSALFLPYANLGVIVVDEAHETSFKQEDGVQYHARDTAVMRAKFEDIPVILSSATPAIVAAPHGRIGRQSLVSGWLAERPSDQPKILSSSGRATKAGAAAIAAATIKATHGGARRKGRASRLATTMQWRMPKKMKLSGKTSSVATVIAAAAAATMARRRQ